MVLVGVHPSLMQVPPICFLSISAVRMPARARAAESGDPPWPAPITTASICCIPLITRPPTEKDNRYQSSATGCSESRDQEQSEADSNEIFRNGNRKIRSLQRTNQPDARLISAKRPGNSADGARHRAQPKCTVSRQCQASAAQSARNDSRAESQRSSPRRCVGKLVRNKFPKGEDSEKPHSPRRCHECQGRAVKIDPANM